MMQETISCNLSEYYKAFVICSTIQKFGVDTFFFSL